MRPFVLSYFSCGDILLFYLSVFRFAPRVRPLELRLRFRALARFIHSGVERRVTHDRCLHPYSTVSILRPIVEHTAPWTLIVTAFVARHEPRRPDTNRTPPRSVA